jgi:glycosyltransferase involved in cell wall biosynthesis
MDNLDISFSVVICTLSNYSGLEQCINSICHQTLKPREIIIVHGDKGGNIAEKLNPILQENGISLKYIKSARSLVLQRNIGIDNSTGDVVVFLDDDVILEQDYFFHLMNVYIEKWDDHIGGVQGVIIEISERKSSGLLEIINKLFLLDSTAGKGTLQVSANPACYGNIKTLKKVDIFSGCMMSFRRDILLQNRFDENFKEFWILDDVDLSYRVSRQHALYQTPLARLHHASSSFTYEGYRKIAKMSVVNRLYLFRKYFSRSKLNWFLFLWSNMGEVLVLIVQCIRYHSLHPIIGFLEGWKLVFRRQISYL